LLLIKDDDDISSIFSFTLTFHCVVVAMSMTAFVY